MSEALQRILQGQAEETFLHAAAPSGEAAAG